MRLYLRDLGAARRTFRKISHDNNFRVVTTTVFSFSKAAGLGSVLPLLCVNDRNHSHEHHRQRPPRWRQVHHSWIFWVAVFLMLLGIVTYVMTGDLFWALHRR
jgi:hypothetical protein